MLIGPNFILFGCVTVCISCPSVVRSNTRHVCLLNANSNPLFLPATHILVCSVLDRSVTRKHVLPEEKINMIKKQVYNLLPYPHQALTFCLDMR